MDGDCTPRAGPTRRRSGLMKYGSSEFKGSPLGAVKRAPRDGDVSPRFMALESLLCFFPLLFIGSQRGGPSLWSR